jgi:hypothetical protein
VNETATNFVVVIDITQFSSSGLIVCIMGNSRERESKETNLTFPLYNSSLMSANVKMGRLSVAVLGVVDRTSNTTAAGSVS